MRAFRFFKCPYSSLYLNEWSFFHNLRYFGLPKIAKAKSRCVDGDGWISTNPRSISLRDQVRKFKYRDLPLEERQLSERKEQNGKLSEEIQSAIATPAFSILRDAMTENDFFWQKGFSEEYQRKHERRYHFLADRLWSRLKKEEWIPLNEMANELSILPRTLFAIVRRWAAVGMIDLKDIGQREKHGHGSYDYQICQMIEISLPKILYMRTKTQLRKTL